MPENPTKREPGMALATARPPLGATSGSCSPCMTNAGTAIRRRSAVRFGWLALAASCRRYPSGSYPRSQLRPARRRPAPYHDVGQARRREVPQVGRFTHIPVVEPDDEKTAPGQALAQLVRPGDHLRRQAHDEHDRRRARLTERLVRQLDAVRSDPAQRAGSDIIHGRSLARTKPSITPAVRLRPGQAPGGVPWCTAA
jgi:hypothetical protein